MAKKKDLDTEGIEQETDDVTDVTNAPYGDSIADFYNRIDLARSKARVFVRIIGKSKFDEYTKKETVITPDTIRKVSINYWDAVLKDGEGKPFEPQEQIGYEVEENGAKKMYRFSK